MHIPSLTGIYTAFPLDTIPIDTLHGEFQSSSVLNSHMRDGFWKYTTERFFYLYEHMKKEGMSDMFHIENDNLIYYDFTKCLSIFQQKEMWCIMDAEDRCIPGFLYFKSISVLERLLHTC